MSTAATKRISIAATIIARDEERCIVRCIESVQPYVDEVVLVDTGPADRTPELARSLGAWG